MHRFAISLAAAALAATATAQTVVIPAVCAAAEGSSSTAYPWGRGNAQIRVQYVYDSSHFTSQGVVSPIVITQLRWRANGAAVTAGYTYFNTTVQMSSAAVDYLVPSTTFASNHGLDLATVYAGPVTVSTPAGTTPNNWYVTVPVTPFLYDPTLGRDLCIDTQHAGLGPWAATGPAHDCATIPGIARTSRIYNLLNHLLPTGSTEQNVGVAVELTYQPAVGLFPNFTGTPTTGATPLSVQFTDNSFGSAPGGITGWAWDFDGDSIIDSAAQNPSHVYTTCGNYNVSLTVTDGVNPPTTFTRPNYVRTDLIAANFTSQVVGPQTVLFTDTSSMPAMSWAWDLDGDAVIDSNLQNPVFAYANTNPVYVTLTVTRLCSPPSTNTKSVSPVQSLTMNLPANTGGASLWTVYFNIDVLNPVGIDITALDSITSAVNTPFTIDTNLKPGPYSGFEYISGPWTKVATASGTSNAVANLPSNATFPLPLHIPAGSYGLALRYIGVPPRYVALTSLATVGNADLSLTLGSAAETTIGAFRGATSTVHTPRGWSGTIHYGTNNATYLAGYGWFGPGCAGTLGVTSIVNTTEPTISGTLQTNLDNLQFGVAVMVIGVSNTLSGPIPLPLDLGVFGAPGCSLRVSLDATEVLIGAGTTASWNLPIPNVPALMGAQLYNQAASLDTTNAFGFVTSHAYGWVVGN